MFLWTKSIASIIRTFFFILENILQEAKSHVLSTNTRRLHKKKKKKKKHGVFEQHAQ